MFAKGAALGAVAAFLNTSITTAFNIKHGKKRGPATVALVRSKRTLRATTMLGLARAKTENTPKSPFTAPCGRLFVGPIPEGMEINHKNLDRADNRLENLELLSHRENINTQLMLQSARAFRAVKGTKKVCARKA